MNFVEANGHSASSSKIYITPAPTTFVERNNFGGPTFHDKSADLTLNLSLMPQFLTVDSPCSTSTLSTPTTLTSFEDTLSSFAYISTEPLSLEPSLSFGDPFVSSTGPSLFDVFVTSPLPEIKQEPILSYSSTFDPFFDMSHGAFKQDFPDPVSRSIGIPSSPLPVPVLALAPCESHERNTPGMVRPFQHSLPNFSSSFYSVVETPPQETSLFNSTPSPLPKKQTRASPKQDLKGNKCDHCGAEKTPLWRKVPHKENAYHCNACGLYYKANGHFRSSDGESRVIRAKKSRKQGIVQITHTFRAGPVTANRNITCANCGTNTTVLWRKGPDGQSPLCNPCGLFYKLHGTHRSPEKRKEIHRRNRNGKKRLSISTVTSSAMTPSDEDVESPVSSPSKNWDHGYVKREDTRDEIPQAQEFEQEYGYQHWHG